MTTTPAPDLAADDPARITAAEQDAAAAEARVTELEDAIRAGDPSIGPDAVPAARNLAEHLRRLVDPVRDRVAAAADVTRRAQIAVLADEVRAAVPAEGTSHDHVRALLVTALDAYREAQTAHTAHCAEVRRLLDQANTLRVPVDTGMTIGDARPPEPIHGLTVDRDSITVDGTRLRITRLASLVEFGRIIDGQDTLEAVMARLA